MSEISISKEVVMRYRNFYRCPKCATKWQDEWDSKCNDRCPACNAEVEPYKSVDIPIDPKSMTDAQLAVYWEAEARRASKEELAARTTLAQLLKCPGTWKHILPEIAKRIR